jgi:hypothetical protein
MEQHPVPRHISGFQFHLIGDMTLRQFIYLGLGIASAFFIFKTAPLPSVVKFSLCGILAFAGLAFAFIPIQDRPLDKWLVAFAKSITSPTQYLWVKNNPTPETLTRKILIEPQLQQSFHTYAHKEANEKLKNYLSSLEKQPHEVLNIREKKYIDATLSLFQTQPSVTTPVVTVSIPALTTPPHTPSSVAKTTAVPTSIPTPSLQPVTIPPSSPPKTPLKEPVKEEAIKSPPPPLSKPANTSSNTTSLQTQLEQLAREKKILEEELKRLKNQASELKEPQVVKPTFVEETKEPTIKAVSPKIASAEIGLTNLPQTPNLITGVVKDPQKKILPNIIMTIKDKNGVPIRALKTNKLGQFITATPISNGTYYLETEDPLKRYVFDIAEITLSGKVFLPIEIIAKGEKEIMREKLTKELFGMGNANL